MGLMTKVVTERTFPTGFEQPALPSLCSCSPACMQHKLAELYGLATLCLMAARAFWDAQTSRPNASSFLPVYCEGRSKSFAVLLVATGNLEDLNTSSVFSFSPKSP